MLLLELLLLLSILNLVSPCLGRRTGFLAFGVGGGYVCMETVVEGHVID